MWACDLSDRSGEGKLGRLFLNNLNFKNDINFHFNQKNIIKSKYLSTLFGVVYCWKKFLTNKKVIYLNYLPLWNFLIFLLLPPKTILGPITGGAKINKSKYWHYLIRKYLFPIQYKISEIILILRGNKIIFSTELLKKYLSKKNYKEKYV